MSIYSLLSVFDKPLETEGPSKRLVAVNVRYGIGMSFEYILTFSSITVERCRVVSKTLKAFSRESRAAFSPKRPACFYDMPCCRLRPQTCSFAHKFSAQPSLTSLASKAPLASHKPPAALYSPSSKSQASTYILWFSSACSSPSSKRAAKLMPYQVFSPFCKLP